MSTLYICYISSFYFIFLISLPLSLQISLWSADAGLVSLPSAPISLFLSTTWSPCALHFITNPVFFSFSPSLRPFSSNSSFLFSPPPLPPPTLCPLLDPPKNSPDLRPLPPPPPSPLPNQLILSYDFIHFSPRHSIFLLLSSCWLFFFRYLLLMLKLWQAHINIPPTFTFHFRLYILLHAFLKAKKLLTTQTAATPFHIFSKHDLG